MFFCRIATKKHLTKFLCHCDGGDMHAMRAVDSSVNSSRGNLFITVSLATMKIVDELPKLDT